METGPLIAKHGFLFYHETQSLRLCGQHAINNLLQQPAFNQRELNLIADHFFSNEVALLHNPGESWYCNPLGDYGIQVIERALSSFNITLQRLSNTLPLILLPMPSLSKIMTIGPPSARLVTIGLTSIPIFHLPH